MNETRSTHDMHNMRIEELPQPIDPAPVPKRDVHGHAQNLRLAALALLVPVVFVALATLTNSQSWFGSVSNGLPLTLMVAAGLLLHRANELDPRDY